MTASGLSAARLRRLDGVLSRHVEDGRVPGLVAVVARRGEVHATVLGSSGAGGTGGPMRRDSLFRLASLTKMMAAATAMVLVEECLLRLDDPVDGLAPELAGRQVLSRPDADLADTVPARRPITLRDLLTFRMGLGTLLVRPRSYPILQAMDEAGLLPRREAPEPVPPDEWLARLGRLPLAYQPGERWIYQTPADVLGILLARAAGQPLGDVMAGRLLGPLGMTDTGFHVPAADRARLTALYSPGPGGQLILADDPAHTRFAAPPVFPSAAGGSGPAGAGGLVSTADDLLAFAGMLASRGRGPSGRILSRPAVTAMTTDQLTERQRADNEIFFHGAAGWGFGLSVDIRRTGLSAPGRFGWTGGTGTALYVDPAEELITILLTQVQMTSPLPPVVYRDFWTGAYQAIDD